MKEKRIIAIGDSFLYLDSHPEETGYRLSRGLPTRLGYHLPGYSIVNLGIKDATTSTWLEASLEKGDAYLILLGGNDWEAPLPIGSKQDYLSRAQGTILGNLGYLIGRIKALSPKSLIFLCNPLERGDYVSINDPSEFSKGSYEPRNGRTMSDIANAIFFEARESGVININTHDKAGFTCLNAVKFKRCYLHGKLVDLPYPNYRQGLYDPEASVYPYPKEAAYMTYDGLHPSDLGAEKLAELIAEEMKPYLKKD